MRKLFILFAVFLVFFSVVVPCYATNEGMYGHYISPGSYVFEDELDLTFTRAIRFEFSVSDDVFYGMTFTNYGIDFRYYTEQDSSQAVTVYSTNTGGWTNDSYRYITIPEGFYVYDSSFYSFFAQNATKIGSDYESSLIDSILSVFAFLGSWLSGAFDNLTAIFWVDNSLTFIGTLSVMGLAFAVIFLIFSLLRSFLKFR